MTGSLRSSRHYLQYSNLWLLLNFLNPLKAFPDSNFWNYPEHPEHFCLQSFAIENFSTLIGFWGI